MSEPIYFKESNADLLGGMPDAYGKPVKDLPVYKSDDGQIISCWRLSFRERLSAVVFGRIWFRVLAERTHPPIAISAIQTVFK
jgi:hypothetical protein